MRARPSGALLFALAIVGGCGGHAPSAPSPLTPATPSGSGSSTTQSIVVAAVNQAVLNTAVTVSPDGLSRTYTFPCTDGGSMSTTFTSTGVIASGTIGSSSRMEFTDCRMQSVTINGDPAILMDGTYTFVTAPAGGLSSLNATTRLTGGVRFDSAGGSGRVRYDCTMQMSMQVGADGKPLQPTIASSGTITWEQPLGTVSVRSCGT